MFSLFAVTKTVSLAVKVPVTGIEIIGDDIVYLDFDKEEQYEIEYAIYPTNAQNRDVTFSTEAIEGETLAELEFKDGFIVPKSAGMAKVYLTTVDGGFKDSIIVQVDATMLESIESSVQTGSILVGDTVKISTKFMPINAKDRRLVYSSSNENVATVNAKGEIIGVGRGSAVITVASASNPDVNDTIEINVYQDDPLAIAQSTTSTWNYEGSINISISDAIQYEYRAKAYDKSGAELSSDAFTVTFDTENWESGHIVMNYKCADESYTGEVKIVIYAAYAGTEVSEECKVNFVKEIDVSFDESVFEFTANQYAGATFTVTPDGADVSYEVTLSNDNVFWLETVDGIVSFWAQKAGVTSVTLKVIDNTSGGYKEATAEIFVKPRSMTISESAQTFGDENLLAVGSHEFDGSQSNISLHLSYRESEIGAGFLEGLSFVTDRDEVVVNKNGLIVIDEGYVGEATVYGVFKQGDIEYKTAGFKIMCVGGGVNVRSFKQLYETVKAGKAVVLQTNVIDDFGIIDGQQFYNESTVTKMHTTYDDTYYKNAGIEDKAFIKILLEFKNDIYGNGYTINASNVTMQLDSAGALKSDALFRGPLNFVAATGSESSAASVKAQDNVSFAIFEGVNVRNVKLYGCTLEADSEGNLDLTDLDYVGTTVEVFGDDVDFKYTRIHNGRVVLRVFGDALDSSKVINVSISNSVLGGAREFIIRMGSNCFVDCPATDNPTADGGLPGDPGLAFPVQKTYSSMTDAEKQAYEEAFIKTFVNVKNSVFTDAGIFAIGIDSHFSGAFLAQGNLSEKYQNFMGNWYDLAKTSYGAKLSFEGEVRMFNWKDIEDIDSSTIIECTEGFEFADMLKFDVKALISTVSQKSGFEKITYNKDSKTYVHGGITIFGGGKNYGVFDSSKMDKNSQFSKLVGYEIGLADAGMGFLGSAAGHEKFYFVLHDSTTPFLPENQDSLLKTENAYECIYYK